MDIKEISDGLLAAGITTQQQLTDALITAVRASQIRDLEVLRERLQQEARAAGDPYRGKIIDIENQIRTLQDAIPSKE
jgi:hypothetical protein